MDKRTIDISDCPSDAILAEDVLNNSGVIVLKAGASLTESKIHSLKKYGIESIVINAESKLSPAEMEQKRKNIEKIIDRRMQGCEMNHEMNCLKNALINYHCKGIQ